VQFSRTASIPFGLPDFVIELSKLWISMQCM